MRAFLISAEKEGFEPPEACTSTVFKTAAFNRSAISPLQKYKKNCSAKYFAGFFPTFYCYLIVIYSKSHKASNWCFFTVDWLWLD